MLLGQEPHPPAVRRHVHAGAGQRPVPEPDVSGVGTQQPREHVEQRRLARPVRAEDRQHVTRGDRELDVEGEPRPVDDDGRVEPGCGVER